MRKLKPPFAKPSNSIRRTPPPTPTWAISCDDLKRYEEAEAAYRKAIELNPSDDRAYSQLGHLLAVNLKRYEEAEAVYRKAIELNPSFAEAYDNLGILA